MSNLCSDCHYNSEGFDMKNNVKQSLLVGFFLLGALSIAQAQQTGATEKAIATGLG